MNLKQSAHEIQTHQGKETTPTQNETDPLEFMVRSVLPKHQIRRVSIYFVIL